MTKSYEAGCPKGSGLKSYKNAHEYLLQEFREPRKYGKHRLMCAWRFSNQKKSTQLIGSILKGMWNSPWESWKDVPIEDMTHLFERFQVCYLYHFIFSCFC
ncbi:hypothetical protein QVD17_06736 [Tagetes erecta]|uniref:Uncharacterized protein n=1 Tax=Tagetes erecta TaxID=13708 RepID=A0AAD8LJZ1_TARER|nr:hypothetical protein QVD17_06736 [Tagetes erecta]